jgi:hypothetical protein
MTSTIFTGNGHLFILPERTQHLNATQVDLKLSLFADFYLRASPFRTVFFHAVIWFTFSTIRLQDQSSIPCGSKIPFFSIMSRQAVQSTRSPTQWVQRILSPGAKRRGSKANHSPTSCAEITTEWSYSSVPPTHLHDVHKANLMWLWKAEIPQVFKFNDLVAGRSWFDATLTRSTLGHIQPQNKRV